MIIKLEDIKKKYGPLYAIDDIVCCIGQEIFEVYKSDCV